jgi:glycosyltransferase involved in cell wall biosynthesis
MNRVHAALTGGRLNADLAGDHGADIAIVIRGDGPAPADFADPRVAAVVRGDLVAVSLPRWRERPFRWDLGEGAVAEWASHWRDRGWKVAGDVPPALGREEARPAVAVLVDRFPELSETFVAAEAAALRRAGHRVVVEARGRAQPVGEPPDGVPGRYVDEETWAERAAALAWLAVTRPRACLRDLRDRARWRAQEPVESLRVLAVRARRLAGERPLHLHAHFARTSALDAIRLARLLGVPASVTAHAWDIYLEPANLEGKLAAAHFATSGCDATVADLRAAAPGRAGAIFKVVMGVDGARFRRAAPAPHGRHVVAIGRLVEKKGFVHLVRAAARLEGVRVTIVGDGPLRDALAAEAARLGVADRVTLAGPALPDAVRAVLEQADLLCAPSVIAAGGDRDSMPVVVKEALAMEVGVVASDVMGLPEIVRAPWGALVPPGDDAALAGAIEAMLARSPEERAAAGRAGREHVLEHASVDVAARTLSTLIAAAQSGPA